MVPTHLRLRRSIVVATGVATLTVGGVAMVWPMPSARPPAAVAPVLDERVVAGPLDGRTAAWLTVGDAAARVRVRFARLPGLLYQISTASDAGVVPVVNRRDGRVTLRLTEAAGDGLDEVRIVLNRSVRWDIRLPAGAGEQQLNLRDGRVRRVEVGAAGLAEVWLPEPDGTVPVVFTGGIGTAVVSVRRGTPVRVHLTQGAGSVETPWIVNNGTAAGTVLREPDFPQAADRYAIRADGGIGALVIRRPPDSEPGADAPDAVVQQPVPGPVVQRPGPHPAGREPRRVVGPEQPRRGARSGPPDRNPAAGGPSREPAIGPPAKHVAGGKPSTTGEPRSVRAGEAPRIGKPGRAGEAPRIGKSGRLGEAPRIGKPGRLGEAPRIGKPGRLGEAPRIGKPGRPGGAPTKPARTGVPRTPLPDGMPGDHRVSPAAGARPGVSPAGPS